MFSRHGVRRFIDYPIHVAQDISESWQHVPETPRPSDLGGQNPWVSAIKVSMFQPIHPLICRSAVMCHLRKGGQWKATVDLLRSYRWHSLEAPFENPGAS